MLEVESDKLKMHNPKLYIKNVCIPKPLLKQQNKDILFIS